MRNVCQEENSPVTLIHLMLKLKQHVKDIKYIVNVNRLISFDLFCIYSVVCASFDLSITKFLYHFENCIRNIIFNSLMMIKKIKRTKIR